MTTFLVEVVVLIWITSAFPSIAQAYADYPCILNLMVKENAFPVYGPALFKEIELLQGFCCCSMPLLPAVCELDRKEWEGVRGETCSCLGPAPSPFPLEVAQFLRK